MPESLDINDAPAPPSAPAPADSEETYPVPTVEFEEDEAPSPLPDDRFLDRELSWLAFNERVLEMDEDPQTTLLVRARFLAIFA